MKQVGLRYFTELNFPIFGLLIFFTTFVFIIFVLYKGYSRKDIEMLSRIPLRGDEE